jgi:hypothetical protein
LEALGRTQAVRPFYLAGGTALALHLGHRYSFDFDWFTEEQFDPEALQKGLAGLPGFNIIRQTEGSLIVEIERIESSFFHVAHPLIRPVAPYKGVSIASLQDVLCMKLAALWQRGAKRDYIDIYFGIRKAVSLNELLDLMKEKYSAFAFSEYHCLRSLSYFDDVENEPMPQMREEVTWDEIKKFLTDESRRFLGR